MLILKEFIITFLLNVIIVELLPIYTGVYTGVSFSISEPQLLYGLLELTALE